MVKAREENMSNYEMSMKLLERLLRQAQGFEFYVMGFTSQSSIKRPSIARGSHMRLPSIARTDSAVSIAEESTDRQDEAPEVKYKIRWEESPLITGVKLGLDDFVIKILQLSPWLATYVDYDGTNVLQAAVKYGRRRVVQVIKEDERLPTWLFTDLESDTNNTLLHIAASNKISNTEANPLRLQDELEWFEMLKKDVVPSNLWDYRNRRWMTAQEMFDEKHERTVQVCSDKLAENGRACSPLLAAVVFTSSFYIPGEDNRESNRLAFKIFSHVYVVGFSFAATSLVMFLMLALRPFNQRHFRRVVPWHYVTACFLLTMSLAAFIIAFACNMYLQIYGKQRKSRADLTKLLLELLLVPVLCALSLSLTGTSWRFSTLKRLAK
ncbi:uncharacterized protein LOC122053492 [Zingiber officinale]|nr:uncharacterized protein LOC122053492 [Zingiber officinale]